MTSTSNQFDANDDSKVAGVSRSGRVRKKSSKLIYFDSTSDSIKAKKSSKSSQPSKSSKKRKSSNTENVDVRNQNQPAKDDQATNKSQKKSAKRPSTDSTNLPSLKKLAIESPPKVMPLNDTSANASVEKQSVEPTKEPLQCNSTTNSDSETYSALSNNEIETPDYTSYDEESPNSDEDLLLPKKVTSVPEFVKLHPTSISINDGIPAASQQYVYTGYILWSSEMKKEILRKYPAIDMTVLNVRLGEMWTRLSTMERNNWHARARVVAPNNRSQNDSVMDYKTQAWLNSCSSQSLPFGQSVNDVKLRNIELEPIDVAAYLRLLGESLMLIGTQLQQRKKPVVTSDCVTVLLDSLLCAMGSLVCLTQQVPLLKTEKNAVFKRTLENIAYIMPGL